MDRPTAEPTPLTLRTRARSTAFTRHGISGLAAGASPPELRVAMHEALDAREMRAATALGMALASKGEEGLLEADEVLRLLPDVEWLEHIPSLLASTQGDRLAIMARAISAGRLSPEAEVVVAFLAVHGFELAPPPPDWRQVLRSLARTQSFDYEVGGILGSALIQAGDADAKEIGKMYVEDAARPEGSRAAEKMRTLWRGPLLEVLPEIEPPRVTSGYTVQRAEALPGRNDPCPCGSGKKYKKCHGAPGAPPLKGKETPSPVQTDVKKLGVLDVSGMRPIDLAQIDLSALKTEALVEAFWRFYDTRRWEDVERVLDLMAERKDLPKDTTADTYREEAIAEALRLKADEVAKRQIEKVADKKVLEGRVELATATAWPSEKSLAVLAAYSLAALKGDVRAGEDLAHAVLDDYPALGVIVARGTLSPDRVADSKRMLEEIERARDTLGLPSGDPAASALAAWTRDATAKSEAKERVAAAERERDAAREEAARLKRELATVRREVAALERTVEGAREEAARARAAAESAQRIAASGDEAAAAAAELEAERKKLFARIDELKGTVAEGNRERTELRRRLGDLEERVSAIPATAPAAAAGAGAASDEDEGSGESAPEKLLIPSFSKSAVSALEDVPANVVRDFFEEVAALASGDLAAWRRVKKLQRVQNLWSARVGIHYRMLFRTQDRVLDILEIVTRENLLKTIERYHR